jgi:succinate dehydrogenase/fumarate reductase flavoprotein subunit
MSRYACDVAIVGGGLAGLAAGVRAENQRCNGSAATRASISVIMRR